MQRPGLVDKLLGTRKSCNICAPTAFLSLFCFPLPFAAFAPPLRQVLVPLVLLQALQIEGQSLTTLIHLGVRFLEEDEAAYIIQQGGWVSFKRVIVENHHI